MALAATPTVSVAISLKDRDGNRGTVSLYYPSGNTIANIQAEVEGTIIPAIQGLSDAVVVAWTISFFANDLEFNPATDAPETSDVERKGVFVFTNGAFSTTKYEVPSVKNTLVIDGTNKLNMADPLVSAFVTAITTAGVDGLKPSGIGNSAINTLKDVPYKMHRKSTKG
jgi:hypothetical protein